MILLLTTGDGRERAAAPKPWISGHVNHHTRVSLGTFDDDVGDFSLLYHACSEPDKPHALHHRKV